VKALVYHGPGKRAWEERPRPVLQAPTDAVLRIARTTICGSDLHILKGDVPTAAEGLVLGHEGVGVVEEVGAAVSTFKAGDRALISCISSCGKCEPCREGMYSHCGSGGGWILGHLVDGTQADFVRIPFADTSLYHLPEGVDEDALVMLSDILPTGFECGVLRGRVKPGDTVAIVGGGPVGLAVLITAQLFSPAEIIVVDVDEHRLGAARALGATRTVNSGNGRAAEALMALTGGRGVDVAVEAVGIPETFDICQEVVAAGGFIANVGVHGRSVELKLEKLWNRNVTITTRLVDTVSIPLLLKSVASGRLPARRLVTHEFGLGELMKAYDVFGNAAAEKALKVILRAEVPP
jgi:alcohol dehydrogenase